MAGEDGGRITSLTWGTLFLTGINLLNRTIGFVYKIVIIRLLGPAPLGFLQVAYNLYFTLLVVATAGVPVAISKLTAEYATRGGEGPGGPPRPEGTGTGVVGLLGFSRKFLFWTSLGTMLLGLGLAFFLPKAWLQVEARQGLLWLLPALFFSARGSLLRGYYQGRRRLKTVGWSLVMEEIVQATVAITLALVLPRDQDKMVVALAWAGLLGEGAGAVFLEAVYRCEKTRWREGWTGQHTRERVASSSSLCAEEKRRLLRLALPVAGGRMGSSLARAFNTLLIPIRLEAAGFSTTEAARLLGEVNGVAWTLLSLPSLFTFALASNLVPAVSAAEKDARKLAGQVAAALILTFAIGWPAALFLAQESTFLCRTLFHLPEAGVYLAILAPAGLFLYLQQTCTGILQGLGRSDLPLRHFLLSAILEAAGIWWLGADPRWGMRGVALAMALGVTLNGALNLVATLRLVPLVWERRTWLRLVVAGLACVEAVQGLETVLVRAGWSSLMALAGGILSSGGMYLFWLWMTLRRGNGYVSPAIRIH